jgi:hypothetical protein
VDPGPGGLTGVVDPGRVNRSGRPGSEDLFARRAGHFGVREGLGERARSFVIAARIRVARMHSAGHLIREQSVAESESWVSGCGPHRGGGDGQVTIEGGEAHEAGEDA